MLDEQHDWLNKARQSLRGAESEFANTRYDNAANRAYYACFQAAMAALIHARVLSGSEKETPSHAALQSLFARELIHRRKLYGADLASILPETYPVRQNADYSYSLTSEQRAKRALDKAQRFVTAATKRLEEPE